jgi:dihydroxy-acid dehydratase
MSEKFRGAKQGLTSYGDTGFSNFLRGVFLASAGWDATDLERPIVGIANTESDFNPCHRLVPAIIENIKRGVLEAGGVPFVFPTMSLGETLISPTSMYLRNLMAMETEEMIRSQPMDAVVLVGGCDKTVPAQAMAAISADVPALLEVVGPMLTSTWRGERLGACTDCRKMWASHRSGDVSADEIVEIGNALATTGGTCMVMGTASTMASLIETLGLMLPGGATPPSPTGERLRHATKTGRAAVSLAKEARSPSSFLSKGSFLNAVTVLAAIGGSTNAIVHLLAMAGRAGIDLTLEDMEEIFVKTPLLLDLKPSGAGYMEDFDRAGGMPQLLLRLHPLLDLEAIDMFGKSLGEQLSEISTREDQSTIHTLESPLLPAPTLAVVKGSLAPDGAVIKVSAATSHLLRHKGPARVFDSADEASKELSKPNGNFMADEVLVLRNSGPVGAGMPEAGAMAIPRNLAETGIKDVLRVSDARMSGTSYGTVVLHCSPEGAVGGPIGLVRDGDIIELNIDTRSLNLLVEEQKLDERRRLTPQVEQEPATLSFWRTIFTRHVTQAHLGADMDLL